MGLLKRVNNQHKNGRRGILPLLLGVLMLTVATTGCEPIFESLGDCEGGVRLRFVYEYHMMRNANAFPGYVDCVTVYVFDTAGNYVTQYTETSDVLQDENYRMELSLDTGSYNLVAYGGLACSNPRFNISPDWNDPTVTGGNQKDIKVSVPLDATGVSDKQLHNLEERTGGLFYGVLPLTITRDDVEKPGYREETVEMMNDVNNIQVILQELDDPYTLDIADFDIRIIDDNFVLNSENKVVEIGEYNDFQPYYRPYATENRVMGYVDYVPSNGAHLEGDEERPVQVACAEFSTSRLITGHASSARLVITQKSTGEKIADLPLITYLLAIRGFGDSWIKSDQEFLDRQNRWNLMLFLQHGVWYNVRIMVNSWVVRLNDADF